MYSLVIVNEYGCSATSLDVLAVICDSTYQPILDDNGSTAWMLDSALYSNLQWYDENGMINGANQSFFPAQYTGSYYIVATDEFGCTYASEPVLLSPFVSSESIYSSAIVKVGPNPVTDGYPLTVYLDYADFSEVTIVLMDLYGREVARRVVRSSRFPYQFSSHDIGKLSNGLYYLDILIDGHKIRKKVVKLGSN